MAAPRCHHCRHHNLHLFPQERLTRQKSEQGLDQSRALLEKALVLNQQLVGKLQPGEAAGGKKKAGGGGTKKASTKKTKAVRKQKRLSLAPPSSTQRPELSRSFA